MTRIAFPFLLMALVACGGVDDTELDGPDAGGDPDPAPLASLLGIEVSEGALSPPFDPSITNYEVDIEFAVGEISVTASAAEPTEIVLDEFALVSGESSPPLAMNYGANTIEIVARLGDAETTYSIAVDRGVDILQSAYVKASNAGESDKFHSVAVSGNTMVVGAPGEASQGGLEIAPNSGAVYVFTKNGSSWSQQAFLKASNIGEGDQFGHSVAAFGDTIVVGAPSEDASAIGINPLADENAADSGAVYVFVRSGSTWSQQAFIKASNTDAGDRFGASIALSGETLVVGAPNEDSGARIVNGDGADNSEPGSGAAYVFLRTGVNWAQQAYLKASNADGDTILNNVDFGDRFGDSVAIDGETLVVGAPSERSNAVGIDGNQFDNSEFSGAAYVFERQGFVWQQRAYIKSPATAGNRNDSFGAQVAVSQDTLAIGASREASNSAGIDGDQNNDDADNAGAVFVLRRDGATWSYEAYLKASNPDVLDRFGSALSLDDNLLVVGAGGEDSLSPGIDGNEADNGGLNPGAAYVFVRTDGAWQQTSYVKASNPGSGLGSFDQGDQFGTSVAAGDGLIVVGAPGEKSTASGIGGDESDDSSFNVGAVYIFE